MKLTEKAIAEYFNYKVDTMQKWKKVTEPIKKEKLKKRYEALRAFYIQQLKNDY